jgi:hypothetical protein
MIVKIEEAADEAFIDAIQVDAYTDSFGKAKVLVTRADGLEETHSSGLVWVFVPGMTPEEYDLDEMNVQVSA